MDQFKCGPSMVTIDFFSAGSLWSLEFCRTKNEQFWANLEVIFKNCHHFTHKSVQKCNFGFYSITGNYTNEIRLKVCQKSNISEENTVANFGFNCKNGNFSPILSFWTISRFEKDFLLFTSGSSVSILKYSENDWNRIGYKSPQYAFPSGCSNWLPYNCCCI